MQPLYDPKLDPHCGRPGCTCDHSGECYRGWLDITDDGKDYSLACSKCDPAKRRRTQYAKDRDEMGRQLRAASVHQQWTGGGQ